ncbi:nucleotidyltransferase domain-containing protein [Aestuariimicrobium ganziense]|uniref:nucleotidyltransferase domain-containing protein n=1 Tax=Aestuariimicrobium ganziense TaxID=2773677 RepID=UPI0019416406|nr:nucleotidyltransferase domain-containing protein [Aestuariimicrobium ganziense]
MSAATERKRAKFAAFVERHVAPHPTIRAVAVYGSVASGHARDDSDADGLLDDDPDSTWQTLGPAEAHDRLNALWEALVAGCYAVNSTWLPYRGRAARGLGSLDWSWPQDDLLTLVAAPGHDQQAHHRRAEALTAAFEALLERLRDEVDYGDDPIFAAFLRALDEPGRAWNMDEWNSRRRDVTA